MPVRFLLAVVAALVVAGVAVAVLVLRPADIGTRTAGPTRAPRARSAGWPVAIPLR